jgi:hypothetical protein
MIVFSVYFNKFKNLGSFSDKPDTMNNICTSSNSVVGMLQSILILINDRTSRGYSAT